MASAVSLTSQSQQVQIPEASTNPRGKRCLACTRKSEWSAQQAQIHQRQAQTIELDDSYKGRSIAAWLELNG